MSVGRLFPLRSPSRSFPFEPQTNGEKPRIFPLPFQIASGGIIGGGDVLSTFILQGILQTDVTLAGVIVPPGGGGGVGGIGCTPTTNLFCVPRATVVKVSSPTAVVRCQ